jgi:hypothetical protein
MSNQLGTTADRPRVYQITVEGHLRPQWAAWFDGLSITLGERGGTVLTGPVRDQAALHGLIKKIRDLGMPLLSIQCVDSGAPAAWPADAGEI